MVGSVHTPATVGVDDICEMDTSSAEGMEQVGYSSEWVEAVEAYLTAINSKMIDYNSMLCTWYLSNEQITHTFARYALPITWDFAEAGVLEQTSGGYPALHTYTMRVISNLFTNRAWSSNRPTVNQGIAQQLANKDHITDAIITDPPYYDAIPYADLSDYFYIWLRRSIGDRFPDGFAEPLTPKAAELVQHSGRFDGNNEAAKAFYENGMAESFRTAYQLLSEDSLMVTVFAHKDPSAWETLTMAMIRFGLVVTASWPIDTEMSNRTRGINSASLATSLWLVCRKRPTRARVGYYNKVRGEMKERITERLRYFWDARIQGPDFVWAAIGPALESYSSYKEVRRMDGKPFTVTEFLTEVRRAVTDFALGQILGGASTEALDEWTRYYLMHRNHFGTGDAPVGECILLAQGYGLSLDDLTASRIGILKKASSGSALRLLGHTDRRADRVGQPHTYGGLPMIDIIHRIMNLWEAGDTEAINSYLTEHGLRENPLFRSVVQALIEMSPHGSNERSLLEAIISHSPSLSAGATQQQLTIREISS